jgi:hypothetical protein
LKVSDTGGSNDGWVVNAFDFVPVSQQTTLTITPPATQIADASQTDTFTVTGYTPGAIYDVVTTLGSGENDADTRLVSTQVQAPASGVWSITVRRPYLTSTQTGTFSLVEIEGRSRGSTSVTYTADTTTRRLDMNSAAQQVTAPGYTPVVGATVYSTATGYGWQPTGATLPGNNVVNEAIRAVNGTEPGSPNIALLRDFEYGSTSNTFTINVPLPSGGPAYTYTVTIYSYDRLQASAISMSVSAEGGVAGTGNYSVPVNTLVTKTFTINSSQISPDGQLDLTFTKVSGNQFIVNGIDVAITQLSATGTVGNSPKAKSVSNSQLQSIVDGAIARFAAAGATSDQLALLQNVQLKVQDLGGPGYLGMTTSSTTVLIDDNGAGYGWFIDSTPLDNKEFKKSGGKLTGVGKAKKHMDLLSVVMHEFTNVLKLNGQTPPSGVSDAENVSLQLGQRWESPTVSDLDSVFASKDISHEVFKGHHGKAHKGK